MKTFFAFILAVCASVFVTHAQQTNRTPINRGFLQSNFDIAGKSMTNGGTIAVSNLVILPGGSASGDGSGFSNITSTSVSSGVSNEFHDASNLSAGVVPDARMPNLTGDVTTSEGAVATTIASDVVDNTKLANFPTATVLARTNAGTGDPSYIPLTDLPNHMGLPPSTGFLNAPGGTGGSRDGLVVTNAGAARFGGNWAINSWHASRSLSTDWRNPNSQVVSPSAITNVHGFIYYRDSESGSNWVFAATRAASSPPIVVARFNADNLSEMATTNLPTTFGEQIVEVGGTLYVGCFSNTGPAQVYTVNPFTLATNLLINDSEFVIKGSTATMETDGTNLYILNGAATYLTPAAIAKYRLSDGVRLLTNTISAGSTATNGSSAHALIWDGVNLFAAGPQVSSPAYAWVEKFNVSDLTYTHVYITNSTGTLGRVTDDMAELGDYLYLGCEVGTDNAPMSIIRVKKDLSYYDFINVGVTNYPSDIDNPCFGVFSAAGYIWATYANTNGTLIRLDPTTLEVVQYGSNVLGGMRVLNEMAFDGSRVFLTSWFDPTYNPVTQIGRFSLPINKTVASVHYASTNEGVRLSIGADGTISAPNVVVDDEAYDASAWNGSVEAPTKNAVRDKIEALSFPQTPYTSDHNAGGFSLTNVSQVISSNSFWVNGTNANLAVFPFPGATSSQGLLVSWFSPNYILLTLSTSSGVPVKLTPGFRTSGFNGAGATLTLGSGAGTGTGVGLGELGTYDKIGSGTSTQSVFTVRFRWSENGNTNIAPVVANAGILNVTGLITNGNSVWYDRTNSAPPADLNHVYLATDTNAPTLIFVGNNGAWTAK